MRLTALIPAICSAVALVLTFLCMFAGHKQDFMEDYHLLTLNTSRLGENIIEDAIENPDASPLAPFLDELPDAINTQVDNFLENVPDFLVDEVNDVIAEATAALGIDDFYSAHILTYCFGQYTPAESPNATLELGDIDKNVTGCSNETAMFAFDPTEIVRDALEESGLGITLEDIQWPENIQDGIDALHMVSTATFVLYVISIVLIFLTLLASLAALFSSGRLVACMTLLLSLLAFLAIGIASALVTAVLVKGTELINEYGDDVGIEAARGDKYLALTWAATGVALITAIAWMLETCIGHRKKKRGVDYPPKHG